MLLKLLKVILLLKNQNVQDQGKAMNQPEFSSPSVSKIFVCSSKQLTENSLFDIFIFINAWGYKIKIIKLISFIVLLGYVMNVHLINITWKENQTEVINSVVTNQGPWQVSHKYQVVWTTAVIALLSLVKM